MDDDTKNLIPQDGAQQGDFKDPAAVVDKDRATLVRETFENAIAIRRRAERALRGPHRSVGGSLLRMPSRPESVPRPKRPNPSDPGRLSEGMSRLTSVIVGGFIAALVVFFAWVIATDPGRTEDKREVRRYGDLECVYNVEADEVESCIKVTG